MFAAAGSAHKERSSKDKKKKRKRHSDSTALEKPTNNDSTTTPKAKSKRPRMEPDEPSHIQPLDTSLTDPAAASTSTPFKTVTTRLYLPISPLYSPHPWLSLESDHLDPLVLTYYPPLRGIILSYRNIRFNQRGARIQADSPFAFTWVTVDFLLWCPQKGDFLEGWVNLQSESHIGLLVLNTFNVSIPRDKIPGEWRWCEKRVGFTPAEVRPVEEGPGDVESMEGVEGGERGEMGSGEGEGDEEEEEEAEEDLGGWMNEKGEYVDGLLRFKVETVKASGHIIAIEGNLLESEADAGQGSNTSNLGKARELPIRPVEVMREAGEVVEIATSVAGADAEPESPVKERKRDKKDKEKKKEKKEKKKKTKEQKDS